MEKSIIKFWQSLIKIKKPKKIKVNYSIKREINKSITQLKREARLTVKEILRRYGKNQASYDTANKMLQGEGSLNIMQKIKFLTSVKTLVNSDNATLSEMITYTDFFRFKIRKNKSGLYSLDSTSNFKYRLIQELEIQGLDLTDVNNFNRQLQGLTVQDFIDWATYLYRDEREKGNKNFDFFYDIIEQYTIEEIVQQLLTWKNINDGTDSVYERVSNYINLNEK